VILHIHAFSTSTYKPLTAADRFAQCRMHFHNPVLLKIVPRDCHDRQASEGIVASSVVKRRLAFVVLSLTLTGCGGGKDPIAELVTSKQLKPIEATALKSCYGQSKTKKVQLAIGEEQIIFSKVPLQLCACQAKEMVRVFTEEGFEEHEKIVSAFAVEPTAPELDPAMLLPGIQATAARSRLEGSMKSCMIKTKAELKKLAMTRMKEKKAAKKIKKKPK
jgi:hypothetical protein